MRSDGGTSIPSVADEEYGRGFQQCFMSDKAPWYCVPDPAGDSGMHKVQAVGEDKAVRLPGRRPSRLLAG